MKYKITYLTLSIIYCFSFVVNSQQKVPVQVQYSTVVFMDELLF